MKSSAEPEVHNVPAKPDRSPLERIDPYWRNVVLLALGLLALWGIWSVRSVLNPLILGYLLAFIAAPLVRKIEAKGVSHATAVTVLFAGAGLTTVILLGVYSFQAWRLFEDVVGGPSVPGQRQSSLVERLEVRLADGMGKLEEWGLLPSEEVEGKEELAEGAEGETESSAQDVSAADSSVDGEEVAELELPQVASEAASTAKEPDTPRLSEMLRRWLTSEETLAGAGQVGVKAGGRFMMFLKRIFSSMVGLGSLLFLLPIYTYFLLFELEKIHAFIARYLPRRDRARMTRVGTQIGEVIAHFFRGRLVVSIIKGLLTAAGLAILGIEYPIFLGLSAGLLSLIPFVGSLVALILATAVALPEFAWLGTLWRVGLVFGLAEVLEGYVLVPRILGESLGLHSVVVLASVMVAGAAMGMFGMLIALPLTASLMILSREFVMPALAAWADEDTAPAG